VNAANGSLAAEYEYDPFGQVIRATGPMAKANPFRFSTKYQDDDSGLNYYGYRFYNPNPGRWLSRDLVGEFGGVNLYSFCSSNPLRYIDVLGLDEDGSFFADHLTVVSDQEEARGSIRQVQTDGRKVSGVKAGEVEFTPKSCSACYRISYFEDFIPVYTQNVQRMLRSITYKDSASLDADLFHAISQTINYFPMDGKLGIMETVSAKEGWAGLGFDLLAFQQRKNDTVQWTERSEYDKYSNGVLSWKQAGKSYYGSAQKISDLPCKLKVIPITAQGIMSYLNKAGGFFSSIHLEVNKGTGTAQNVTMQFYQN